MAKVTLAKVTMRMQTLIAIWGMLLSRDRIRRLAALRERFGSLNPREREIMVQVARGRRSKQIAGDIGISEATVKAHRSWAMRKVNVRSLAEFGRIADKLKLVPEMPQPS